MAIPHKYCRADAQSAFSSDCPKRRRNTGVFQGVLGKNDGKDASVCAAKRAARSLRGVALSLTDTEKRALNLSKRVFILSFLKYLINV